MFPKKFLASVLGLSLVVGSSSAVSAAVYGINASGSFAEDVNASGSFAKLVGYPACLKILVEDVVKPTLLKTGDPDVQDFYSKVQSLENSDSTDVTVSKDDTVDVKSLEQSLCELYENNPEFREAYDAAWTYCHPHSKKERWGSRFNTPAVRKRWGSRFDPSAIRKGWGSRF